MAARQRWHGKPKKGGGANDSVCLFIQLHVYSFVVCLHTVPAQELRCASMCACASVLASRAYTLSQTHILFILFSFFARFRIFRTRSCFFRFFLFIETVSLASMTNTCNDHTVVIYHTHWQTLARIRYLSFITKENLITFGREIVVCVSLSSGCVFILFCVRAQMSRLVDIFLSESKWSEFLITTSGCENI